jgi:DNA-binding response OmpR family regulator
VVADVAPLTSIASPYTVGVVADDHGLSSDLARCLEAEGISFITLQAPVTSVRAAAQHTVDVLLIDMTELDRRDAEIASGRGPASGPPSIAAISWDHLQAPGLRLLTDDVIVVPWRLGELHLRVERLLERKSPPEVSNVIRAGDLVIDPDRYDVYLAGKPVLLTFKEYELLKLLAANPGRVYSREALLEQVWGYKYFGGTRTVDVHIRRLRSKIEDAVHNFIDTVWNVGYRFHD